MLSSLDAVLRSQPTVVIILFPPFLPPPCYSPLQEAFSSRKLGWGPLSLQRAPQLFKMIALQQGMASSLAPSPTAVPPTGQAAALPGSSDRLRGVDANAHASAMASAALLASQAGLGLKSGAQQQKPQ